MLKSCMALVLAVVIVAGCSKKPSPTSELKPPPREEPRIEAVYRNVDELMQSGNTNAAITALNGALEDEAYAPQRQDLFRYLLHMLLQAGRVDEARDRYLAVLTAGTDETLARSGFGVIGRYYTSQNATNELAAWVANMVELDLPEDLATRAYGWHLQNTLRAGRFDDVLSMTPTVTKRFGDDAQRIFGSLNAELLAGKQYDQAARLLSAVEENAGDIASLKQYAQTSRVDLYARWEQWQEAEKLFLRVADGLDEEALQGCFSGLVGNALKQHQSELVDRLCTYVFEHQAAKAGAVKVAARQWVANASGKDPAETCRRLKGVVQSYLTPVDSLALYNLHFYQLVDKCSPEDRKAILSLGDGLASKLENEGQRDQLRTLVFDGSFMVGDYERALNMLEEGLPNRGADWHTMAINKLKAHMALEKGDVDEAVKRFQAFMDHVSSTLTEPERDPSTGLLHTREMALGFNAKRIGDILDKAGRTEAAGDAYAESRAHYLEAIRKLKEDSPEYAMVQETLASLPGAPGAESAPDK